MLMQIIIPVAHSSGVAGHVSIWWAACLAHPLERGLGPWYKAVGCSQMLHTTKYCFAAAIYYCVCLSSLAERSYL